MYSVEKITGQLPLSAVTINVADNNNKVIERKFAIKKLQSTTNVTKKKEIQQNGKNSLQTLQILKHVS